MDHVATLGGVSHGATLGGMNHVATVSESVSKQV